MLPLFMRERIELISRLGTLHTWDLQAMAEEGEKGPISRPQFLQVLADLSVKSTSVEALAFSNIVVSNFFLANCPDFSDRDVVNGLEKFVSVVEMGDRGNYGNSL